MRRSRFLTILAAVAAVALAAVVLRPAQAIEPESALKDFEKLRRHLSEAWANMEWIASHRGMDLARASSEAEESLRGVSRSSFVKHPHWQAILESKQRHVRGELGRADLPEETRGILAAADGSLQAMIDQTLASCDRMPMWEGQAPPGGCSNLVEGESYTCGHFPHLEPGSLDGMNHPGVLYKAFDYESAESVNTKPLVVIVDRGTASASEDFGSILQDNGAATLVGSRTYGAGCGFVNGGIPLRLEEVGLRVMAPDCVRYRKDGTNEIEGIVPDVEAGWTEDDSRAERTAKVLAALSRLAAAGAPR